MMAQITEERCQKKTDHAKAKDSEFCACGHVQYIQGVACCNHTHLMHTFDEKTKLPKVRCNEVKGGGGRYCSAVLGHRGGHVYECGV